MRFSPAHLITKIADKIPTCPTRKEIQHALKTLGQEDVQYWYPKTDQSRFVKAHEVLNYMQAQERERNRQVKPEPHDDGNDAIKSEPKSDGEGHDGIDEDTEVTTKNKRRKTSHGAT